ncbi:hypothetical protein [Dyadobacter sp. CY356]|uniref:hypothetical protein n=1 Tax=Dyadobacter sp. CY356 TaxID=2906442 RepID=UPI001F1A7AA1|nr:hypothetical protein [Dyadobacter sp. CY356]MCF0055025.1 hypothetical protein [Dyadobacter sp. CY356]
MNKIVCYLMFFCLSVILWDCKKKSPKPDNNDPFERWNLQGESGDRPGPGFSWRLSTDNQTDGYFDLAGDRLFYLSNSSEHSREVVLTVTKLDESFIDPTFRIYGRFEQCLLMSKPTISSGAFKESGTFQGNGIGSGVQYSGITWTPTLSKKTVNSKETFKFKVYINSKDSLCTEGFVQVDMVGPAAINSEGSYLDGDHLYFIKKSK